MTQQFDFEFALVQNPYRMYMPDPQLRELVLGLVVARAADIGTRSDRGEYEHNRLGYVILDPTAPVSQSSDDSVLAIGWLGTDRDAMVPNAAAKAFEHRDRGEECGTQVYVNKQRLAGGDFRYGYSVCLDGTYVGVSGLTEKQDRFQATLLAAEFNLRVTEIREAWEEAQGPGRWLNEDNAAPTRFTRPWSGRYDRGITVVGSTKVA